MNNNKIELIAVIAEEISDASCAKILQRIKPFRHSMILADARVSCRADWDESEHPRDKGGQFIPKGFGEALSELIDAGNDKVYKQLLDLPKTPIGQRIQRLQQHLPEWMSDKPVDDKSNSKSQSKKGGKGQSIVEICQEFLDKAKADGDAESVKEWTDKLEQAKVLSSGSYKRKQKKTKDLVKRFQEVEDEMDEIEEAYGDRDKGVGFKWPETQEADEARKRYRKLKREWSRLNKQIDWKSSIPDE